MVWHRLAGGGGSLSVRGIPLPPVPLGSMFPGFMLPGLLLPEPPLVFSPVIDPVHDAASSVISEIDRALRLKGAGLDMSYSS
jgi:hypothetical protein